MVPIESPSMVCSFKFNIVSVTISRYLLRRRFKVIQGQSSWCQSIAHEWFPIRLLLTQSLYLSPFSQIFDVQYTIQYVQYLEVGQSKSDVVSVFIFEIFDKKILSPRPKTVQGHPRSKVMVPRRTHLWFPI